jgi:6-phosphofructokinase 1
LVRGNEDESTPAPTPQTEAIRDPFDTTNAKTNQKKYKRFVPTYGEGALLKEGEGEQTLRGRYIIQVGWDDMRGFLSTGGTLIGTARSEAFRTLEGRRQAVLNLVKHNIEALIVCGGDGSLTGADRLRAEWGEHMALLKKEGRVTQEQFDNNQRLNIVGLVGSIDNDMAGTDMTIGKPSIIC